jgi:hypothetical protein
MKKLIDITGGYATSKTLVAIIHFETEFPREWKDEIEKLPRKINVRKIEFTIPIEELTARQHEALSQAIFELKELWKGQPITKEEHDKEMVERFS